jgi:hypothetical protein
MAEEEIVEKGLGDEETELEVEDAIGEVEEIEKEEKETENLQDE